MLPVPGFRLQVAAEGIVCVGFAQRQWRSYGAQRPTTAENGFDLDAFERLGFEPR
jgi:hypothetical protein